MSSEDLPLEVPKEALIEIFSHLDNPKDLAAATMVCKQWLSTGSAESLWKPHVARHWRRRGDDPKGTDFGRSARELESQGRYRKLFLLRTNIDAQLRKILRGIEWNSVEGKKSRSALLEMPFPLIQDELERLTKSSECGTRYWANYAHKLCLPRHVTKMLKTAIEDPNTKLVDVALLVARLFDHIFLLQGLDGEDYAYTDDHSDFVHEFLDEMATEVKRRMALRGITGGLEALELVNEVMFSPHPEESRPPNIKEHRTFPVRELPLKEGYGYEMHGNPDDYYSPMNSLVDFVLMSGTGNPISLCILHGALADRVGVRIATLNTPGHVINYYDGEGDDANRRFIDCFNGGEMFTRGRINTMRCTPAGGWAGALNNPSALAMSPRAACLRILLNLLLLGNFFTDPELPENPPPPPSEIVRRLLWVYMSLYCKDDTLTTLHPGVRSTFLQVINDVRRPFECFESEEYVRLIHGMLTEDKLTGPPEWSQTQVAKPRANLRVGQVVRYGPRSGGARGVGVILDYGRYGNPKDILRVHKLAGLPDPLDHIGSATSGAHRSSTVYVVLTAVPKYGCSFAFEDALTAQEPLPLKYSSMPMDSSSGTTWNSLLGLELQAGRFFDCLSSDGTQFIPNAWMRTLFDDTWE